MAGALVQLGVAEWLGNLVEDGVSSAALPWFAGLVDSNPEPSDKRHRDDIDGFDRVVSGLRESRLQSRDPGADHRRDGLGGLAPVGWRGVEHCICIRNDRIRRDVPHRHHRDSVDRRCDHALEHDSGSRSGRLFQFLNVNRTDAERNIEEALTSRPGAFHGRPAQAVAGLSAANPRPDPSSPDGKVPPGPPPEVSGPVRSTPGSSLPAAPGSAGRRTDKDRTR